VGTRIRQDAWKLWNIQGGWDPVMLAYARAVQDMKLRPATDPTSWQYQAAIHGSSFTPASPLWNECQHGQWYFLAWHRLYLYFFERILLAAVTATGGPPGFALPYWDYDQAAPRNALPPQFRATTLPDQSPNPLFVAVRSTAFNIGAGLAPLITSSARAMSLTTFVASPGSPSFGGAITGPLHFAGAFGALELTPHNAVHSEIGGWMGDVNSAPLDPVFWLHHANIDRLWEVWLALGNGRSNPSAIAWRDQAFTFYDEFGVPVSIRCRDIVDTVNQLGYLYQ
jgi:hypothetical protein